MTKFKRVLSVILCIALLITTGAFLPKYSVSVKAASISQLQQQLESAKAQSNQLKAQITALEKANAPYEQQAAALRQQINATKKEIDLYQAQINACNSEISALEQSIKTEQAAISSLIGDFKQRLIAIYTGGSSVYTGLEFLLSSESIADYLSRAELLEAMTRKDNEELGKIVEKINACEEKQAEIEKNKAVLDSANATILQKKQELTEQYNKVNKVVLQNGSAIAALEAKERDYQQMQKDIAEAIKKQELINNGAAGTGKFAWPVPGYYYISSPYGWRIHPVYGTRKLHTGTDISGSGIYGARIVAADSGTVMLNKDYGGYGWCVMINHNNGYVTLYAHMKSKSPLKIGQTVIKGQTTIGYVGESGTATGPHLHFEIQKNGATVNPMSYY